jgi:hypothetical protein
MRISAHVWTKNNNAVSVSRGPLTYSLKIAEKWKQYGDSAWPAFEVFPAGPWNYALKIDPAKPEATVRVASAAAVIEGQPFRLENAPIQLKARAQRIAWAQEKNGLVGEQPASPAKGISAEEEITLIPMGCARLRISAFPTVN